MHCPFGLSIHGGFIFFPFKHRYRHSVDRQMLPMHLGPSQNIPHTGAQGEQSLSHCQVFQSSFLFMGQCFCSSTTFHKVSK